MRYFLLFFTALLAVATLVPSLDLAVSGLFYRPAEGGFWIRDVWLANALHEGVQWGSRIGAVILLVMVILNIQRKAMLFLLLALIIGPGLLTNTVLKDNWGRARPIQVQEFGGTATFTPALQPTDQCDKNCSFVSGDGALGFFLHTLFYVVPLRWRRRAFALGFFGSGILFGGLRVVMGAHFLSDVLWAGLVMLISSAALHTALYGRNATRAAWRNVL